MLTLHHRVSTKHQIVFKITPNGVKITSLGVEQTPVISHWCKIGPLCTPVHTTVFAVSFSNRHNGAILLKKLRTWDYIFPTDILTLSNAQTFFLRKLLINFLPRGYDTTLTLVRYN